MLGRGPSSNATNIMDVRAALRSEVARWISQAEAKAEQQQRRQLQQQREQLQQLAKQLKAVERKVTAVQEILAADNPEAAAALPATSSPHLIGHQGISYGNRPGLLNCEVRLMIIYNLYFTLQVP